MSQNYNQLFHKCLIFVRIHIYLSELYESRAFLMRKKIIIAKKLLITNYLETTKL